MRRKKGENKEKGKNKKKMVLTVIFLLVIAVAIIVFYKFKDSFNGAENIENTVAVQSVKMLTETENMSQNRYSGKVISQKTLKIQKDQNRTIKKVYVEVGQSVKKGDKLFEYDTDEIKSKIDQENLEVEKMQNSITNSKKQIETLNTEKNNNPSESATYTIEIQTLENEIKQSEYSIKSKNVEIDKLRKSLKNVVITSEIDGIVQSIKDSGDDSSNNIYNQDSQNEDDSYMSIMQTGAYRVQGSINEQNIWALTVGEKVLIHSRTDENAVWTGTIESIDTSNPESNKNMYYSTGNEDDMSKSSRYPFYITLDSMEGLMMGQHVYIERNIGQEDKKEGLWLSNYYIIEENGEYFVWSSNNKDRLEKRNVKIGEKNEELGEYQITEGLSLDDYIAIPEEGLEQGKKVTKFDNMEDFMQANMNSGDNMDQSYDEGQIEENTQVEGNQDELVMTQESQPESQPVQ